MCRFVWEVPDGAWPWTPFSIPNEVWLNNNRWQNYPIPMGIKKFKELLLKKYYIYLSLSSIATTIDILHLNELINRKWCLCCCTRALIYNKFVTNYYILGQKKLVYADKYEHICRWDLRTLVPNEKCNGRKCFSFTANGVWVWDSQLLISVKRKNADRYIDGIFTWYNSHMGISTEKSTVAKILKFMKNSHLVKFSSRNILILRI